MTAGNTLDTLIPHDAPIQNAARAILVAIRRLASSGLQDAHATNIFITNFGMTYRRPLMFLRVLIGEVSRVSKNQIAIAPCCCPRMTEGEAAFLLVIESARSNPELARNVLVRMTGTLDCLAALSVAQALGDALDDIGHPFRL